MKKIILVLFMMYFYNSSIGQQLFGSIATDWTLRDIPKNCSSTGDWGTTWNLYDVLNNGKHVVIDISGAYCAPCWDYHNTHRLETLWSKYGPDGSDSDNSNSIRVFYIENECYNFLDCLCDGENCYSTRGDWTEGVSYPIFDPSSDPQNTDCEQINEDYHVSAVPSFYAINAEHKTVWDLEKYFTTPTVEQWESWLFGSFSMEVDVPSVTITECETTIDISATGGFGDLTYLWSNGESTEDISGELNGSYSVTVTDENGYYLVKEVEVNASYTNCPCLQDVNVDLSTNENHTVNDMLQAMNLNSLDELCNSNEQYNILLGGTLILDYGSSKEVCFDNSKIAMLENAKIEVINNSILNLNNTNIFGCSSMWDKIFVESGSEVNVMDNSIIADALFALYAEKGAELNIENSTFYNNDIGIYLGYEGIGENTDISISGSNFTSDNSFNDFGANYSDFISEVELPKAGIYILGQNHVNLKTRYGNNNTFENLKNGIRCTHGSIEVAYSIFRDIHSSGLAPIDFGPSGNGTSSDYLFYRDGFGIKITNCTDKSTVFHSKFTDAYCAVGCSHGILEFSNSNEVSDVNLGVVGYYLENVEIIRNYNFFVREKGIFLNNCLGGNVNVSIDLEESNISSSVGIELINSAYTTLLNCYIENSKKAGIFLQNSWSNEIIYNTIQNNNTTSDDFGAIVLESSDENILQGNNLLSTTDNYAGIIVSDSYGCEYSCNKSTGFNAGMHFIGVCDNSNFQGNEYNSNSTDLVVGDPEAYNTSTNMAVIGRQGDWDSREGWGNKWLSANSTVHNSGTQEIINASAFLVKEDPDNPEGYMPENIQAETEWFSNKAVLNLNPCDNDEILITPKCEILIQKILEIDTLSEMDDCVKLMWQYKYFKELMELKKKGLLSDSCKQFLLTQMGNVVLQVVYINKAIDSINYMKINVSDWGRNESARDSIKQTTDSIRLVIDNIGIVDSCIAVLNKVNKIKLNQIDNDTLSQSDISILQPIAEACPNELGESVYMARSLLSMYQDGSYSGITDCMTGVINPRSAEPTTIMDDKLLIFPNPATDFVDILVDLSNEESGMLKIVDMKGEQKYKTYVTDKKLTIDTKSYALGVYIVKYKSQTGEQVIKKLVIAK